jgi:hypothetical protein
MYGVWRKILACWGLFNPSVNTCAQALSFLVLEINLYMELEKERMKDTMAEITSRHALILVSSFWEDSWFGHRLPSTEGYSLTHTSQVILNNHAIWNILECKTILPTYLLGSAVPFYIVFFIITKLIRKLNHTDSKFAIEFDSSISQLWVRRLR